MKISVKAKPNAREESVEKVSDTEFVVSVKEPPVKGLANDAIIRALAGYFGVSKAQVKIISGWTARNKMIEVIK